MNSRSKSPGTVSSKSAYHHGDLREQLINAARQLIYDHGATQFKLCDACRLAGVSTAAPYRHFTDREELIDAVVTAGFNELSTSARKGAHAFSPGTYEAITSIGTAYVEFARRQPNLFRLMFGRHRSGEDACQIDAAGSESYQVLLQHVALFKGSQHVDAEVEHAAFPLWIFVHGLSFILIDNNLGSGAQQIDLAELIGDNCRRLLVAESRT
jgi:AcrR family transcriptional regulator